MTPKEIVRRTLDFDYPERVARSFRNRSFGDGDFMRAEHTVTTKATDWRLIDGSTWERTDEWGNRWRRIDATSKGEVAEGALHELSDIDTYEFPDFSDPGDYGSVREKRTEYPDHWLIGGIPGFAFNIARKIFKLENYLANLMLERERIAALHDKIDVMLEDMIRNYARAGADSVMFPEDWGTQTQTLISPSVWHEEFYPRFDKLCSVAHEEGTKVFMHSCGAIGAIIPGLMDAGIDLFQFDQPGLHGIDTLASYRERANITFWCPVDIQTTLQTKDESVIRAEARELLDKLWQGKGGFIAGYYSDSESIGLEPKWQNIACDEFLSRGKRENYIGKETVRDR